MGARLRWAQLATVLLLAPCSLQLVEGVPWDNPLESGPQQQRSAGGGERGAGAAGSEATEFRSTLEMHATRDPVLPHGPSMKLYHVSSCIGINNCRLLGNIYDPKKNKTEVTMLHMWVRIIVEGRTARLKGFGIMEPLEYYRRFSKHASHTLMLYAYKPVLFLKSPYTGRMYGPIVVTYKYSGLEIPMAFNAFIDNLDEEDAIHREFEIRSNHTTYYCEVFGERLRRRMPQPVDGTKELALNKPAYVLFSSFHHMPASQVAPLLYYHMQWHKKLGVSHYTIYQEHMVKGLVSDPRIKDLIRSGLLTIVFFDEFRLHENNLPAPTLNDYLDDAYANQVLVYNHGVLAHWLLDVYVIVSDIDEYLMTPKHMALPEAMRECAVLNGTSLPVSTVTVLRYDAYCRGCNQSESELPQWVNHQGTEHPITKYVMLENTRSEKGNADNTKYIILPGLVDIVKVHKAYPVNGTERIAGDVACLRLLHLYQMLVERKTYDGGDASLDPAQMPVVPDDQWWWPVRDFLSQQQQQQGGGLGDGLHKRQSHRKALAASHSMIIDAAGAA